MSPFAVPLLVTALNLVVPVVVESPNPVLSRIGPPPATGVATAAPAEALASVDPVAVARFRAAGQGRLVVPLADGRDLPLLLDRCEVLTPDAVVVAEGRFGPTRLRPDVTLFRGVVEGDPDGWAVVSMSGERVIGVISTATGRHEILPPTAPGGPHVIAPEGARVAGLRFECLTEEPEAEPARPLDTAALPGSRPTPTRLICRVAVDCDYEFYADVFGGDLEAATEYALALVAVSSVVYERDINVALRVPLLTIWTTPDDPWTAETAQTLLGVFGRYWRNERAGVARDLAILIMGRGPWGRAVTIGGLCSTAAGYALCSAYGGNPSTEALGIAHEIGHIFGAYHTHSCEWAELGYVPAGTLLDSCYTAEGTCYSGPTGVAPPDRGTLMSYCHLLGWNHVRFGFHPVCIRHVRSYAQSVCLLADSLQPPRNLIATATSAGNVLGWTASPTPGVTCYDVYKATQPRSLTPTLLGTTAGTSWMDPESGDAYYKVRAIWTSTSSDFSNEAKVGPCGPSPRTTFAPGGALVGLLVGDLFGDDGLPDLAVLDSAGVKVTTLQGARCASCADFEGQLDHPLAAAPRAAAAGYFDGDGLADLAVVGGGWLTVLAGQAGGSLTTRMSLALPTGAQSAIALADLDEDGITDLVVADGDSLRVLRGQGLAHVGDGTFAPFGSYAVGPEASGLVVGDFDEDGIADLAVAVSGGVAVLRGQGSGRWGDATFAAPATCPVSGGGTSALVAGDFDRNGILDLAVAVPALGSVAVLAGQGGAGAGDGTFGAAQTFACGANPLGLVVGDLDGDGAADLVTANHGEGTVGLLWGRGDGTFEPAESFACGPAPRALAVRDLDEDGRPDLLVADATAPGTVSQLLFRCAGAAATTVEFTAYPAGDTLLAGTGRTISWRRGASVATANLEFSPDGGARWLPLAVGTVDTSYVWTVAGPPTSQARLRVYDPTVPTRADGSGTDFTILPAGSVGVEPPVAAALTLAGARPNPARAGLAIAFTLADRSPATLELFDVAGRCVRARGVGHLGPGSHVVDLGSEGTLPAGVFVVRLTQGGAVRTTRVVHLP